MKGLLCLGVGFLITVACCMDVFGQDRMPQIPGDNLTAAQQKAIDEFRTVRKAEPTGPFIPMLRSPEVMIRARAMGDYMRYRSVLPPRLSEFVILMTARQWTQRYEWSVHYPIAIKAGVNPDVAKAVADGRRPEHMQEDEEILYNLVYELQRNQSVSDATYAQALSRFGEQGIIDTVGIVGYYTFLAMVLNTARTPAAESTAPVLAPFPR